MLSCENNGKTWTATHYNCSVDLFTYGVWLIIPAVICWSAVTQPDRFSLVTVWIHQCASVRRLEMDFYCVQKGMMMMLVLVLVIQFWIWTSHCLDNPWNVHHFDCHRIAINHSDHLWCRRERIAKRLFSKKLKQTETHIACKHVVNTAELNYWRWIKTRRSYIYLSRRATIAANAQLTIAKWFNVLHFRYTWSLIQKRIIGMLWQCECGLLFRRYIWFK